MSLPMHTVMDLELLNYINMDMKWNILKKYRTGMARRPRKLGGDSFDLDNKVEELFIFETKKFGIEKVVNIPIKKRRLLHQSPSPPPQTLCLNGEVGVSPGPQTPAVNYEDSGQRCRSSSLSQGKKTKSKTRLRKNNIVKPKKNKVFNLDDFSGIELLAAAACSSLVNDSADHADLSVLKEQTTPGINPCTVAIKEAIISSPEIIGSSIQDDIVANGNEGLEKNVAPSKGLRLHWDLNSVMDEWEKPCGYLLAESHSQENCSKSGNSTLEGSGSRCTDAIGAEERSLLDSVNANQLHVKHDAAISVVPLVGNCNCNVDSFVKTYELIEDLTCAQKVLDTKTLISMTSDGESSLGKSDVIDSLLLQEKCKDFFTSTALVLQEQTTVIGESDQQPLSEEVMQDGCQSPKLSKSSCDNRVTSDDPLSECCGSNVTQDAESLMVEGYSEEKLEVGYDSPYEDGELREPIENPFSDKDDVRTVENTLLEKVDHGQTMENQNSLFVKETLPNNDIEQGPQSDTFKSPDFSEWKDELTSFEYVQRTRSSNFGDSFTRSGRESGVEKSIGRDIVMDQLPSRKYNPRGAAYKSQNRRHSPSERNSGYGSNRGPLVRNHSRDRYRGEYHDFKPSYFERKPHLPPKLNRPRSRSRSRSGSPIAWNFQKGKNLDTCNSGEIEATTSGHMSPERSSKYTDDQNRDKRRLPVRTIQQNQRPALIRNPERFFKSNDYFRYTQYSSRFSQMTEPGRDHRYKDNNDAIRKHDSHYEKVNRLGRHDEGFRRFRDNDSFENRHRRNPDCFSKDSPKEQRLVTPPERRS